MLRTLAINSNQIVLSFGVFVSKLITKAIWDWGEFFGIHKQIQNTRSLGSCTLHPDATTLHPAAATLHPAAATFHPDILHPALDVGWERRAFQLPWSNISGSADSTHPEDFTAILHSADSVHPKNFAANFAQCRGVLLKLPDMCDRHL